MTYFNCKIHGQNFTQAVNGRVTQVNFYTMGWIEADSRAEAARHAIELVSRQLSENGIAADAAAKLEVEDVKEAGAASFDPEFCAFIFY